MAAAVLALLTIIVITLFAIFGGVSQAQPAYKPRAEKTPDPPRTKTRRVMFNKYNTERRYGKKTGVVLSTAVVEAPLTGV